MANVVYEVRFVLGEGLENANPNDAPKFDEEDKKINDKSPRNSDDIIADKDVKKRKAKIIAQASTVIATGTLITNMMFNYQNTNYQISGDYIGAQRNSNIQSQVNEFIGLGTTLGMGFAVGGLPGGIASAAYAGYSLAIKAYNYGLETRRYMAQVEANIKESAYQRERLVNNIAEVR